MPQGRRERGETCTSRHTTHPRSASDLVFQELFALKFLTVEREGETMTKGLLAIVGLAVISAGGSAQDVQSGQEKVAFEKKSYPYEGEVTVERLNVRMFPKNDQTSII